MVVRWCNLEDFSNWWNVVRINVMLLLWEFLLEILRGSQITTSKRSHGTPAFIPIIPGRFLILISRRFTCYCWRIARDIELALASTVSRHVRFIFILLDLFLIRTSGLCLRLCRHMSYQSIKAQVYLRLAGSSTCIPLCFTTPAAGGSLRAYNKPEMSHLLSILVYKLHSLLISGLSSFPPSSLAPGKYWWAWVCRMMVPSAGFSAWKLDQQSLSVLFLSFQHIVHQREVLYLITWSLSFYLYQLNLYVNQEESSQNLLLRTRGKKRAGSYHMDEQIRKELCLFILDSSKIHATRRDLRKAPNICCTSAVLVIFIFPPGTFFPIILLLIVAL